MNDAKAATAFEERRKGWSERLPPSERLWYWLEALPEAERIELLAFCTAMSLDALHPRKSRADELARAVALDMAEWWRPTAGGFFSRLSKAAILACVEEGVSKEEARYIAHLKKDRMAASAERLLKDTNWLPEPLRMPQEDRADDEKTDAPSSE